jgi:ElaB/YqjD/DUF883 family membrane-anchored ribosome-binding protein
MSDWSTLNDTLEEQLRRQLIHLKQENDSLRSRIELLESLVKDEQEQKYNAYKRISELIKNSNLNE